MIYVEFHGAENGVIGPQGMLGWDGTKWVADPPSLMELLEQPTFNRKAQGRQRVTPADPEAFLDALGVQYRGAYFNAGPVQRS